MAISDHCLCVSKPRCLRASWNVTSNCQRITYQLTIRSGSASRSVHRRAWGSNPPSGARIKTQRTGTAGKPVEYHTAVSEAISTVRSLLPYQSAILIGSQTVLGSSATTERLGSRSPLSLEARSSFLPGASWRSGLVEGGIQPETGDEGHRLALNDRQRESSFREA